MDAESETYCYSVFWTLSAAPEDTAAWYAGKMYESRRPSFDMQPVAFPMPFCDYQSFIADTVQVLKLITTL